MSKQRSPRGQRGIPGPPGPAGKQGTIGAKGKTGTVGAKGKTGAKGAKGATGARGTVGGERPATTIHREVLLVIHDQIHDIYQELDIQLRRMAQLQAQLDEVRATVARLMGA